MEIVCPNCGEPLTDPRDGQSFTPIDIPTIDPSKVCTTCKVGYWWADSRWLAVATLDVSPQARLYQDLAETVDFQ